MGCLIEQDDGFVEPFNNPSVYCDGVAGVSCRNGQLHIAYFVEQPTHDGRLEKVITLRLVFPTTALLESRRAVDEAMMGAVKRLNA